MLKDLIGHVPAPRRCPYCKRPIVWIKTPDGKPVAVDAAAPCYRIIATDRGTGEVSGERDLSAAVLHICTCPKADRIRERIAATAAA